MAGYAMRANVFNTVAHFMHNLALIPVNG
jgi:hypothetical protein